MFIIFISKKDRVRCHTTPSVARWNHSFHPVSHITSYSFPLTYLIQQICDLSSFDLQYIYIYIQWTLASHHLTFLCISDRYDVTVDQVTRPLTWSGRPCEMDSVKWENGSRLTGSLILAWWMHRGHEVIQSQTSSWRWHDICGNISMWGCQGGSGKGWRGACGGLKCKSLLRKCQMSTLHK